MAMLSVRATYIGGPTVLLEIGGFRLLTDPTLDPGGTESPTAVYTLHKVEAPALSPSELPALDAVLLSHDHHFDNLDRTGRLLVERAPVVFTTTAGAERLGGNALGLAPWTSRILGPSKGQTLRLTGTPARHGPVGGDRGPVTGFLITDASAPEAPATPAIYVSGDTVWYEELEPIAKRVDVGIALLFGGAARVREVGPAHLTMTAEEMVTAARALPKALIVPLHYAGWAHFSEGRAQIEAAFEAAALSPRLLWLPPGRAIELSSPTKSPVIASIPPG
jgi:L-ascorbate metabolism protein UlaG (beta-lactamase superfamily)